MTRIVSISSLKGGVGKTSCSLGLASAALAQGLKVLLIDLDPHGDSSTGANTPTTSTDIGTMLQSPSDYRFFDQLVPSAWNTIVQDKQKDTKGLLLVARGSAAGTALEQLTEDDAMPRLNQLLEQDPEQLKTIDLIIIDCPPTLGRISSMAWVVSEHIISVAEPSLFSVAGTERTIRAVTRFKGRHHISPTTALVILNKVREEDPEHIYRLEEMQTLFGERVLSPALPEFHAFQRIVGASYPLHFWPDEKTEEFAQKFTDLLNRIMNQDFS